MGGGSALTLLPPFPADLVDPVDPQDCSKIGDFIERVVIFGLDGAPASCFSDFFRQPRANHLLLNLCLVKNRGPSRMGSRKIARSRPDRGSAQNFAAVLMEATVSFFEETGCCF